MNKTAEKIRVPQLKNTVINVTPSVPVVSKKGAKMSKTDYRNRVNEQMYAHVSSMIPTLIPGKLYTLKNLCSQAFWKLHYPASHRGQGYYIARHVKNGKLPLICWGHNSAKAKLYMIK